MTFVLNEHFKKNKKSGLEMSPIELIEIQIIENDFNCLRPYDVTLAKFGKLSYREPAVGYRPFKRNIAKGKFTTRKNLP